MLVFSLETGGCCGDGLSDTVAVSHSFDEGDDEPIIESMFLLFIIEMEIFLPSLSMIFVDGFLLGNENDLFCNFFCF